MQGIAVTIIIVLAVGYGIWRLRKTVKYGGCGCSGNGNTDDSHNCRAAGGCARRKCRK